MKMFTKFIEIWQFQHTQLYQKLTLIELTNLF